MVSGRKENGLSFEQVVEEDTPQSIRSVRFVVTS